MTDTKRIVFTGHRNRLARDGQLEQIVAAYPGATWVHGGAFGFDTQVKRFAKAHGIPSEEYLPDYNTYGTIAPLMRNDKMLTLPGVVAVVAAYDGRWYGGTAYTLRRAEEMNLSVTRLVIVAMTVKEAQA